MLGGYQLIDLTNLTPIIVGDTRRISDSSVRSKLFCDKLKILKINIITRGSVYTVVTPLSSASTDIYTDCYSSVNSAGISNISISASKEYDTITINVSE